MTATTDNVREAIHAANAAYDEVRSYIEGIDEEHMLAPGRVGVWSGKDLVIHLAVWEREGIRVIGEVAGGGPEDWFPYGINWSGLDDWNIERVAEHEDLALEGAMRFWDEIHHQLIAAYEESGLDRPDILTGVTRDHYRTHYPDFRHIKPFKPLTDEQRRELLDDMDHAHREFREMIDGIPQTALEQPNTVGIWSGKDLIAHLGHWQEAAADLVRSLENDQPGKWPGEDGSDINDWNQERVEASRSMSLSDVKEYQQRAYENLYALIRSSPKATRSAGIGGTRFHYDIHREDFERVASSAS